MLLGENSGITPHGDHREAWSGKKRRAPIPTRHIHLSPWRAKTTTSQEAESGNGTISGSLRVFFI